EGAGPITSVLRVVQDDEPAPGDLVVVHGDRGRDRGGVGSQPLRGGDLPDCDLRTCGGGLAEGLDRSPKRFGCVLGATDIGHCGNVSLRCVVITYRRVWNGCAPPRRRGHDGGHGTDGGTSHRPPVVVRPACRCVRIILEPTVPTAPHPSLLLEIALGRSEWEYPDGHGTIGV